ncbi:FeoA domain-containing protein [candidate division KSB1 bacterium]|nr:FeoA domain-containing protein [candidate division KSB1 bacterium]
MFRESVHTITLADLAMNQRFRIVRLSAGGEIRKRLIDMGFIAGAEGILLREALLKDPLEIQLKGYRISVRRTEARDIIIEKI